MSVAVHVEVTNTLEVPFTSGFQRHTRELLERLPRIPGEAPFHVVPVIWCVASQALRTLTADETHRLANPPTPRAPSAVATFGGRLPEPVARVARRLWHVRPLESAKATVRRRRAVVPPGVTVLDPFPGGSWLVDLEACWHVPWRRDQALPVLRAAGVHTAALIADVMPEQHPEWFVPRTVERFGIFLRAHLESSDHFLPISRQTEADLAWLARRLGRDRPYRTSIIQLGADFHLDSDAPPRLPDALAGKRIIVCVATLEPRKNQAVCLDALELLTADHPDLALVLIGREGWGMDTLVERIADHPLNGTALHWFPHADDDLLAAVVSHAVLALAPSRYEGYGMPVIEALGVGVPVVSSGQGALAEASGDLAEICDPDDPDAWAATIARHLDDPAHHAAVRARVAQFHPPTWDRCAEQVAAALAEMVAEQSS